MGTMNLPKFLYAEDLDGDREFVIHNHWPRFTMEFVDGAGTPEFLDDDFAYYDIQNKANDPAASLAHLMREAGDFFAEYHRRLEEDY
jgi:hypothetical protein